MFRVDGRVPGGCKTLLELQKPSSPPNVRLGAAKAIVELSLRTREVVDFEERLAAIEKRLQDKQGKGRAA